MFRGGQLLAVYSKEVVWAAFGDGLVTKNDHDVL
jgi:hypothetical protein